MHIIVSLVKWLFTLHQLVWFVAGGLMFGAMTYFHMKLKQDNKANKLNFTFILLSACTFVFTILWTYDSYMENEVRAANMGLLVFGGLAVVFAILGYRFTQKNDVNKVEVKGH
ncbi:YEATS-associated helix-containing protein [Tepidibacter aestuarii]|uniref:YEATS-associated helix-containing protein n=1 Tax=Tepidibacter aestuarii TaxID=2925782 RepID=UPI0020BEB5ED|nr:hypothetical protein [Tepidibacter aestuarii]CAH2213398.1 conserved membrane protein of unknown function [Tepidibacter aestuarii]